MSYSINIQDAAAVLASGSWLAIHRLILNRGFLISRRGPSTDTIICFTIGLTAALWTAVIFMADPLRPLSLMANLETQYAWIDRVARAPLIVDMIFGVWLVAWLDGIYSSAEHRHNFSPWHLSMQRSLDWASSINTRFYYAVCAAMILVIVPVSMRAAAQNSPVAAALNVVGLAIFLTSGTGPNPYVRAPHRYTGDMLRIALPTSHHEGTTYILPSARHGIDAVWGAKVHNEHIEADGQAMALFQSMRSQQWSLSEPLERIRHIVAAYQKRVILSKDEVLKLARWLYQDSDHLDETRKMYNIECDRAPNVHLIGRDLMYALCHAEYLVFLNQGTLPSNVAAKLGTLRLMKRSGAPNTGASDIQTIGFEDGLQGYRAAARYVYALFDQPLDRLALEFDQTEPPPYSYALSGSPESIEEYVAELWNVCCQHTESTFTALYMFTTVWFMEMGNVNGFHIFPLRCKSRNGDMASQQIVWRQAWYCACIAQLIASSPLLFVAYISGYLQ